MKLLSHIKTTITALTLVFAFAAPSLLVLGDGSVAHASTQGEVQKGINGVGGSGSPKVETFIKNAVNILLFVVGAISVVMIVVGGLRYVISQGDSNAINGAKNTVLYAVIGLVIAIMAYSIVNFVVDKII